MEELTTSERGVLQNFVTDVDSDIFGLINLPDVVKGAVFSRYSRSDKTLKRTLLDEFINNDEASLESASPETAEFDALLNIRKAEDFYKRVLVGYGDDSIAELAGAHVAVENISSLAADVLTDSRIGISPLEKSARYVKFTGPAQYYTPPEFPPELRKQYIGTVEALFKFYNDNWPVVYDFLVAREPFDVTKHERKSAYDRAMSAQTCDVLKNALPAARLTNVGLYGNGRAFEALIQKMYNYKGTRGHEIQHTAEEIHGVLRLLMPVFVKRAEPRDVFVAQEQDFLEKMQGSNVRVSYSTDMVMEDSSVVLWDWTEDAGLAVVNAMVYPYFKDTLEVWSPTLAYEALEDYAQLRKTRRDKLSRAFETVHLEFAVRASYAAWRDIHRHRLVSQVRKPLNPSNGYVKPPEWAELGLDDQFETILASVKVCYQNILNWAWSRDTKNDHVNLAEYVVPRCVKTDWYMHMNAREAAHLIELRSGPQGHPEYRRLAQEMWAELDKMIPSIAQCILVDNNDYSIARIGSENRTEQKKEQHDG